MSKPIVPPIIIDTREQTPFEFKHPHEIKTLKTGDYSIGGIENEVAVERKRHNEFIQCMTGQRDRFERELDRSQVAPFRRLHIVVEASLVGVLDGLYDDFPNQTHPNAIRGTLAAWTNRYPSVQFWFAGDHEHARDLTEHLLKRAWRDKFEKKGEAA